MPPTPWTPNTSSASSAPRRRFRPLTPHRQTPPARRPMISAPPMPTKPQAGVIATSPATAPDAAPSIERRARVEAEPAHPQQRRADHRERQVVRGHRFPAVADPLAHQERADEA